MLSGLFMIIVLVFPEFFLQLSSAIGIVEPVNMIFLLQGAFLLCICISLSVIVSGLNRKLRALIQDHALLEKRVRDLEKQMQEEKWKPFNGHVVAFVNHTIDIVFRISKIK